MSFSSRDSGQSALHQAFRTNSQKVIQFRGSVTAGQPFSAMAFSLQMTVAVFFRICVCKA
jgi:hypothetical protein